MFNVFIIFKGLGVVLRFILLIFMSLLYSCSSFSKWAMRSQAPLFNESAEASMNEYDWKWFKDSTPANIKFIESLYWMDPSNEDLLPTLMQAYSGYAFGVFETEMLALNWSGVDDSSKRVEATEFYQRALMYGWKWFKRKGLKKEKLIMHDEVSLTNEMNNLFSKNDIKTVFFMAQSWGSLINLNKKDIVLISQIPKVKILFDWVCEKDPSLYYQSCEIFKAQYALSRSKMLGGDPELGQKIFEEILKKNPEHELAKSLYIQFVLIPTGDKEKTQNIIESTIFKKDEIELSKNNLFNAIGRKRIENIRNSLHKLF